MEILLKIIFALPLILFWSAVLSFVPIAYYLLIRNPPIYKAEHMREVGIFVIGQQQMVQRSERRRVWMVLAIYGICVVFFIVIFLFNVFHDRPGIIPFDILSTLSVIFFGVSVMTYLPIAFYLILKNPWHHREEGTSLTRIFIGYGISILCFSAVFVWLWLKSHKMSLGIGEMLYSLFILLFSAVVLAYLPTCFYIFSKVANPWRLKRVHPNVIFVIYSICFLVFASVFIANWVTNKKLGIQVVYPNFSF